MRQEAIFQCNAEASNCDEDFRQIPYLASNTFNEHKGWKFDTDAKS
jgi:hypothetical protein